MKKVKIIIGKRESGKSSVAKAMTCRLPDEEKISISAQSLKNTFPFHCCTEKTKAVIIEDFRKHQDLWPLIFASIDGLVVDRQSKESLLIFPEIIIVCDEEITRELIIGMGASTERRLEIIETIS